MLEGLYRQYQKRFGPLVKLNHMSDCGEAEAALQLDNNNDVDVNDSQHLSDPKDEDLGEMEGRELEVECREEFGVSIHHRL